MKTEVKTTSEVARLKILFYGANEIEVEHMKNWAKKNECQVDYIQESLTTENIALTKNYDGIVLFPPTEMLKNEKIYRDLEKNGICQLSVKSTGFENINFDYAQKYHLKVTNVPAYSPTSVGHFTVMLILMLLRNIPEQIKHLQTDHSERKERMGRELENVTIGVLGTGRIGSVVAENLADLGATVIASSNYINLKLSKKITYVSFDELVARSDVLTIHIPLSESSTYLFSDEVFARMKDQSYLINCSRGKIIDTKALIDWMQKGKLKGLALDTLEKEERYFQQGIQHSPYYQQLIQFDNVIITPHIAYFTDVAVQEIVETALENVKDILQKGSSLNLVI